MNPIPVEEPSSGSGAWSRNVGAPVVHTDAPTLAAWPERIDVLCWNVAIGVGRLEELLVGIRAAAAVEAGAGVPPPLVLLVQEAFRADDSVPGLLEGRDHGGRAGRGADRRTDIVSFARANGLSLCYAPSMRNGTARSDRGNAVLSTCRIGRSYAFSLPLVRQRRVAVAAELVNLPGIAFVSAHFENRGRWAQGPSAAFGLGTTRAEQAHALGARILDSKGGSVVLGADLNTVRGHHDPAFRSLLDSGFRPAERVGRWRHTFHGVLRLPLDHLLYHSTDGAIRRVEVRRLDENQRDSGPRIFGSDHHPLLARVYLSSAARMESAGAHG